MGRLRLKGTSQVVMRGGTSLTEQGTDTLLKMLQHNVINEIG